MSKSIKGTPKKRGRPATDRGLQISMRWQDPDLEMIDDWIARQNDPLTRPEAIRRLVEIGLTVKTKATPPGRLRAALVADLAAETIDSLGNARRPKRKTRSGS